MADIFLSYAREDRKPIALLAREFERLGWSVWWDNNISIGKPFGREIESALASARCIVVVWSDRSVNSDWVRAEAFEGLNRGILVPVLLRTCIAPLPFRTLQTADLRSIGQRGLGEEFPKVLTALEEILGKPPATPEIAKPRPSIQPVNKEPSGSLMRWRLWRKLSLIPIITAALLLYIFYENYRRVGNESVSESQVQQTPEESFDQSTSAREDFHADDRQKVQVADQERIPDLGAERPTRADETPQAGYMIYMRDGRTLQVRHKYEVRDERAIVTLLNGTQAFLPLADIDVSRTEEINAQRGF
jgi:hypothetical protein